jgi:hypothetical protein
MQNFIVLGYIPGTQIQINFTGWLVITASLVCMSLIINLLHRHRAIARGFAKIYQWFDVQDQQLPYMPAF